MGQKTYRRKHYLVDKDLQGRFIFTFVLICVSGMILAIGLFNYIAMKELDDIKWRMVVYENTLADIVTPHLIYMSIFAILFTATTTAIASWLLTWKVAGPIYRLRQDIESIGDGNLSINIRLRRRDVFKETAGELDKMVFVLRGRYKKIDEEFKVVNKIIDSLKDTRENLLRTKSEQLSHSIENLNVLLKSTK